MLGYYVVIFHMPGKQNWDPSYAVRAKNKDAALKKAVAMCNSEFGWGEGTDIRVLEIEQPKQKILQRQFICSVKRWIRKYGNNKATV